MLLTFLSLSGTVFTFFVFPLYVLLYPDAISSQHFPGADLAMAFIFLIFKAPIRGCGAMGKMLVE